MQAENSTYTGSTNPGVPTSVPTTPTSSNGRRVKVIGYAQKKDYGNGIEYRNFTDDLVGNQQTDRNNGSSSNLTIQNFVTTTNSDGKLNRFYSGKQFSPFNTLESLNLTVNRASVLLNNNIKTVINTDKTNLSSFAYFGSTIEYIRVSLENIITNWPASLYLEPNHNSTSVETFYDYNYKPESNSTTFSIKTNYIDNKYEINYQQNGTIINTFNEDNSVRNLTVNHTSYVVLVNNIEYPVINFSGSTSLKNDFIRLEVLGQPFTGDTYTTYHIKPKKELEEEFYNSLNEFEGNLLNRLITPKYTSEYTFKVEADDGTLINKTIKLTWPVTDGYNLDFNTNEYINFAGRLLEIGESKDLIESNLMARFLTSESISDFDTVPKCDGGVEITSGQKMNKTLKIYGREFDEIKKYIDGISFANVVTYDKKGNIPDQLVKYLGRTMGWDLISSIGDNDLISSYLNPGESSYKGFTRGYTPQEAEVELWRRLILNSAWIWKSKGTRKSVEFFFKFIGAPEGLVNFNEFIYKVKEPIDMTLFKKVLDNNNLSTDLNDYLVDQEGYPKLNRNNSNMYYQKGGQWYRQTGGEDTTQHKSSSNNPHVGPYDNGREYINQLENIIPNFKPFTISETIVNRYLDELFLNYNKGKINDFVGTFYIDVVDENGTDLKSYIKTNTNRIVDPCPQPEQTDCGCDVEENDNALRIEFTTIDKPIQNICNDLFKNIFYDDINNLWVFVYQLFNPKKEPTPIGKQSIFAPKECCTSVGGNPFYYEEYKLLNPYNPTVLNKNEDSNTLIGNPNIENNKPINELTLYSDENNTSDSNASKSINNKKLTTVPEPTEVALFDPNMLNNGNICCKSKGVKQDLGLDGCGCVISCQWQLVSRNYSDMYLHKEMKRVFLKFIDPAGNIRVVNEADSCFCIPGYTTPIIINDPYTNTRGYGCALEVQNIQTLYYTYYYRAIRRIDCDSNILISNPIEEDEKINNRPEVICDDEDEIIVDSNKKKFNEDPNKNLNA